MFLRLHSRAFFWIPQSTVELGLAFRVVSPVLLVSVQLFHSFEDHVEQNICIGNLLVIGGISCFLYHGLCYYSALTGSNSNSFMIH